MKKVTQVAQLVREDNPMMSHEAGKGFNGQGQQAHPLTDTKMPSSSAPGVGKGLGKDNGPGDNPGKGHGGGSPGNGGGNGQGQGQGKGQGQGQGKGDLYGDQYVLLRDLDPSDGGGNGEPVRDANGQLILVGSDGSLIYYQLSPVTGEYEIPADKLALVQEVELGRANVARAPDPVLARALDEALAKIMAASVVQTDAAGRLLTDGVTIDSPLQNLALYKYLMTAGGQRSWTEVKQYWPDAIQNLENWDPSSLLGAAFDKFSPVTLDAVLYQHTILGVNSVSGSSVSYFDFTDNGAEAYDYSRQARWGDTYIQWYENLDDDPDLELVAPMSVFEAVFGGVEWVDEYLRPDGTIGAASKAGINDFAQAIEDARAVIYFMHENFGAIEVPAPMMLNTDRIVNDSLAEVGVFHAHDDDGGHEHVPTVINGTNFNDWLYGAGSAQLINGGNGDDHLFGRGGPDTLIGGNGSDYLDGGGGPDVLYGGNGADYLDGKGGRDALFGGNGKDVLVGRFGGDTLTGGNGPDTFKFFSMDGGHGGTDHDNHNDKVAVDEVLSVKSLAKDTITDFKIGVDVIDFSELGVELHWAQGPQAFGFWVEQAGDDAMVFIDIDGQVQGSQPAELAVQLQGVHAELVTADSFVV